MSMKNTGSLLDGQEPDQFVRLGNGVLPEEGHVLRAMDRQGICSILKINDFTKHHKRNKAEIACSAAKSSASKLVDVPSSKILMQAFHIVLHFPCCINQSFIKVAVEIHDECLVSDALHWFSIDNFRGLLDAVCRDFVDPKFDTLAELLIEICWIISITMVASSVFFGSEAQCWRPLEGLFARRYARHFYCCGAFLVHA